MIPAEIVKRVTELSGGSPTATRDTLALMRHEGDPQCVFAPEGNFRDMACPFTAAQRSCCGTVACAVHHECTTARRCALIRKLADLPEPCLSPEHGVPTHMVVAPGIYEHICPSCGHRTVFTVSGGSL